MGVEPSAGVREHDLCHFLFPTRKPVIEAGALQSRGFGELAQGGAVVPHGAEDFRQAVNEVIRFDFDRWHTLVLSCPFYRTIGKISREKYLWSAIIESPHHT
jgi:hypothetical protein